MYTFARHLTNDKMLHWIQICMLGVIKKQLTGKLVWAAGLVVEKEYFFSEL